MWDVSGKRAKSKTFDHLDRSTFHRQCRDVEIEIETCSRKCGMSEFWDVDVESEVLHSTANFTSSTPAAAKSGVLGADALFC